MIHIGLEKNSPYRALQDALEIFMKGQRQCDCSIFVKKDTYDLIYSTVEEMEDRTFLVKAIQNIVTQESKLELQNNRLTVKDSLLCPLMFLGEYKGVLLIEEYRRDKVKIKADEKELIYMIGFYVGLYQLKKISCSNYHIDPLTRLPNKIFLKKVVDELHRKNKKYHMCAIRVCGFFSLLREKGEENLDFILHQLADCIRKTAAEIGGAYKFSDNTFILLSEKPMGEVFDRVYLLFLTCSKAVELKVILIDKGEECNNFQIIIKALENEVPDCTYVEASQYQTATNRREDAWVNLSVMNNEFFDWMGEGSE